MSLFEIDELREKILKEIEACLQEMKSFNIVKIYDTMSNSSILQISELFLSAIFVYYLSYIYPINVFLLSRSLPIISLMVGTFLFLIPINILISFLYRRKVVGILKNHGISRYVSQLSELEIKEFCKDLGATLRSYEKFDERKIFDFFNYDYNYLIHGPRDESIKVNMDEFGELNVSFLRNSYGLQGRLIVVEKILDFPTMEFDASYSKDGLEVTCPDDAIKEEMRALLREVLNPKILNDLSLSNKFHLKIIKKGGHSVFVLTIEDYVPIGEVDYGKLKEILLPIMNSLRSLSSSSSS
ncbi:MAG: hypothetical protein ACTSR0_02785 [Candidatus Asgardarchaeia archaeon]